MSAAIRPYRTDKLADQSLRLLEVLRSLKGIYPQGISATDIKRVMNVRYAERRLRALASRKLVIITIDAASGVAHFRAG